MSLQSALNFDGFPPLPQLAGLRIVAANLWKHADVIAIWLGGSFAGGNADRFSDVDLRIAVAMDSFPRWQQPPLETLFHSPPATYRNQPFGRDAILHHILLQNGDIYDLFVQAPARDNFEHAIQILACRDDSFGRRLCTFAKPLAIPKSAADGKIIRQLICDFWLNSHKHRTVIHRDLNLLVMVGINIDHVTLMRLWYASLTGLDTGDARPSIHGLTQTSRLVQQALGTKSMQILGASLTSRDQILAHIEHLRDEVSAIGRTLADQLRFDYPNDLEQTVRDGWRELLAVL